MAAERALVLVLLGTACGTVVEPRLPEPHAPELAARPLSRADCVELALHSVPNLATWQARRALAEAEVRRASALPNPRLSASWEDFGIGKGSLPVQQTFGLAFVLEALFARGRSEAAADHELAAEVAQVRAEQSKLVVAVSDAHDRLVAARLRIGLRARALGIAEAVRQAAARFVAAGLEPVVTQDRADAEVAQAGLELARAEGDARMLEIEFAFALGFARPVALRLQDPIETATGGAPEPIASLLATAALSHPEIVAARERYSAELERARLEASGLRFLPTVSAGPRFEAGDVRGVAGLEVEVPLFDLGSAARSAAEASLTVQAARARVVAHEVAAGVARARERLVIATDLVERRLRPLATARKGVVAKLERLFAAGEATLLEVSTARREAVDGELEALAGEVDLGEAARELALALGTVPLPAPHKPE